MAWIRSANSRPGLSEPEPSLSLFPVAKDEVVLTGGVCVPEQQLAWGGWDVQVPWMLLL